MKKVLLVEDSVQITDLIHRYLKRGRPDIELLVANTMSEAKRLIGTRPELDLVVLDGHINGEFDGLDLLEELREWHRYSGPILTIAGNAHDREKMLEFGATHEADKTQMVSNVSAKIIEILDTP